MKLHIESDRLEDYLEETEFVDFHNEAIRLLQDRLFDAAMTVEEKVQSAFHYVRDQISHTWDIQSSRVTKSASEVETYREGICYAKSNLLAALLRSQGIPAGFCYQRLTIGDTPETGYCIHALNGVYLQSLNKWIRLDARGNKPGVDAQYSTEEERLAFPVRQAYGEIDYPGVYPQPNHETMAALRDNADALQLYLNELPTELR